MRTFTRLTVVSLRRSVDLAVPDDMALPELVRSIVREAGEEPGAAWVLHHPVRGPILQPHTIGSFGVRDGETLVLRADPAPAQAIAVEEVAQAVADDLTQRGTWSARSARVLAASVLAGWLVAVPALATVWLSPFAVTLLGLASLAVAVTGLLLVPGRGLPGVTAALVPVFGLVPIALAVATGQAAQWAWSTTIAVALLGSGLCLLIPAGLDREVRRAVVAVCVGAITFAVLDVLALLGAAAGLRDLRLDAVVVVVLVLLGDGVTWLAARLSGLSALEERAATGGEVTLDRVVGRAGVARWGMAAALLALASLIAVSASRLALGPDVWGGVLAVVVLTVTALRARNYAFVPHVLALVVPVAVTTGYVLVRLASDPAESSSWVARTLSAAGAGGPGFASGIPLAVVFGAACAALLALSLRGLSQVQLSQARLWAGRVETVLLFAAVPLALGVFDAYAAARRLVG